MRRRHSIIVRPEQEGWVVLGDRLGGTSRFARKRDATLRGRQLLQDNGGGELIVHSLSGRIVDRNEVTSRPRR